MSLTEPTLADPIQPADAWKQAAERTTPFGQYLGEKLLGGLEATRPAQALEMAMLPPLSGVPDEYGIVAPPGPSPVLSKEAWETGPHQRPGLEWDPGMTEARAEALATQHDRLAWNGSLIERYQGGYLGEAAGFVAGLAPGVADPTNYVPLLGPAAKAAMVARLGAIGGNVALHGAEAAANTALFEPLTASHAATFGQPYGWQDAAADVALGALAGAVGGAIHGGLSLSAAKAEYRGSLREAATRTRLETVMAAADATSLAAEQVDRGLPVDVAPVLAGRLPEAPRPSTFDVGGIVPRRAGEARPPEAPRASPPGIDALHASPHEFDRFDLSAARAGDDAQWFGHGGYFSDAAAPDVHQAYLDQFGAGAHSYRARLAVDPGRLLDWHAKLGDQPEAVREAIGPLIERAEADPRNAREDVAAWTGDDLYKSLAGAEARKGASFEAAQKAASAALDAAGVHGIRATDRARGPNAHDYTIFDEKRIHLLERDGRPLDRRAVTPGPRGEPSFATATPEPPHPSVAEAARRVGKAEADPLATFKADAGLEGYQQPLPGHEPKPEPVPGEPARPAKPERPPTREERAAALAALPPELAEIEAMRREGSFRPGDEATLAAGEAEAQKAENYAAAWTTLAGCVARAVVA